MIPRSVAAPALVAPIRLGQVTLAALVAAMLLWAGLAPVAQGISAHGRTGDLAETVALGLPEGGRLAAVFVTEGQVVRPGTVLARFDSRAEMAELARIDQRLTGLSLRRAVLEATGEDRAVLRPDPAVVRLARRDPAVARQLIAAGLDLRAATRLRQQQVEILWRQSARMSEDRAGLDAQFSATARQTALITAERDRQQSLRDRGLAEESRVLALDREAARLEGEGGALLAAASATRSRQREVEAQVLSLTAGAAAAAAQELAALTVTVAELGLERRRLRDRIAALSLTSPVGGQVLGLRSRIPGQVLRPAEPLLTLVPIGGPAEVTARLRPEDRSRIAPGQTVDIRLPGPAAQRLTGRVAWVSADAVESGGQDQPPHFLAGIALDPQPHLQPLPRGLPVDLFIETGPAPLLTWLLGPLAERLGRAGG